MNQTLLAGGWGGWLATVAAVRTKAKAKANAAKAGVAARAADDPTPWWNLQKELVEHAVTYVTELVDKVVDKFNADAESERDLIADIAVKQEELTKGAAELRRAQTVADSLSWQTFRVEASGHQRTYLDAEAQLNYAMMGTRATADKAFSNSSAEAAETRDIALAGNTKTAAYNGAANTAHSTSEAQRLQQAAADGRDSTIAAAEILRIYARAIVTAKETLGLARSGAQLDYSLNVHDKQETRSNDDTDSYAKYVKEVAEHAATYAVGFAGKYATYLKGVSTKADETAKEEDGTEKALVDAEAQLDKTRKEADAASWAAFLSASAGAFQTLVQNWSTSVNTPWSRLKASDAEVEVEKAADQGTILTGIAAAAGGVVQGYLTALSGIGKTLADAIVDGLDGENQTLADAVKNYAIGVAGKRKDFAVEMADAVAAHDKGVTGRTKTFKNSQSTRQKTRDNAVDGAQWTYERAVADLEKTYTENVANINYNEAMETITPEAAATQRAAEATNKTAAVAGQEAARKSTVAGAESTRVNGNAADFKGWVNDVGQKIVDLATTAKGKIDALASDLKSAEDGLTTEEANAAKALAAALANAEAAAQTGSAQAGAGLANGMAGVDGDSDIDQTGSDNDERESLVHNRNTYENEIRQEHLNKLLAASPPDAGLQNLLTFQRSAAQTDVTWSVAKGVAIDAYEQALSAAYMLAAQAKHGVGGAERERTAAQGAADVAAVSAQANADAQLAINQANRAADYSIASGAAATKVQKDGTVAQSKFNLDWVKANKQYNDDVAAASVVWTGKHVEIEIAIYLETAIPYVPSTYQNPPGTTDETNREGRIAAARTAIEAEFAAAEKAARATFAGKVGDAQVSQAGDLGDALVSAATTVGNAETALADGTGSDQEAYEGAITAKEVALAEDEGDISIVYSNHVAELERDLTAALGAANVQLTLDLGQAFVAKAGSLATAEGVFWSAESTAIAGRYAGWASGQNTTRVSFLSAQANTQAEWIADIAPAYADFTTAMVQADANRETASATAIAAKDNADQNSHVTYVAATEPLYAAAVVASVQAERLEIEQDAASAHDHGVSESTAQSAYDVAIATAARTKGVSLASAEKAYQVGLLNLAAGASPAALVKAYDLTPADAEVARETAAGDASVTWTTAVAAADKLWAKESAEHHRDYLVEFARVVWDLAVALAPHDEALFVAQIAAQTNYWTAETNAANAHRSATDLATANYQEAELSASASATATLAAAVGLPWADYREDLAAVRLNWFISTGRSQRLVFGTAINSAHATYQATFNAGATSWAVGTALAEKDYTIALANTYYAQAADDADSAQAYQDALADAEEPWQIAGALIRRSVAVGNQVAHRNFVDDGNAEALNAALAAVVSSSRIARDQAAHSYTVSEAVAWGDFWKDEADHERDGVVARAVAAFTYAQSRATLDYSFAVGAAGAAETRDVLLATADKEYHLAGSDTWADAIDALAQANSSPWANYDDALAAAVAEQDGVILPARLQRDIMLLDAIADLAEARALATRDLALATAAAELAKATAQSQGLDARATTEAAANLALASVQNLGDWNLESVLSSTVLDLAFTNVQGCQTLTLLPVEESSKFVAFQAHLEFVFDV